MSHLVGRNVSGHLCHLGVGQSRGHQWELENTRKGFAIAYLPRWSCGWRIGDELFPAQDQKTSFSYCHNGRGNTTDRAARSTGIKQSLIDNHKNRYSVSITPLLFIWLSHIKSIRVFYRFFYRPFRSKRSKSSPIRLR